MEHTRMRLQYFCFRGDNYMGHPYWSFSLFLPNIIKLSQTIWELWPAQDFGSRGDNCTDGVLKTFVCTMDPKHSTPLAPPLSLSSNNDVNSVCSTLELLDLHIGKQESSLLAYVDIVKGMLICISHFYSILFAFVIIVCISHFLIYFVCFCHTNANGHGKSSEGAQLLPWKLLTVIVRAQ